MKCEKCKGEWTPPPGKSVTECPFCKASFIKDGASFNNAKEALQFIADNYGIDALLTKNLFSDVAPTLKDERDLVKIFRERGVLDSLKDALNSPQTEQKNAIKRAMDRLPKYLHDSQDAILMLNNFAEVIGWSLTDAPASPVPTKTEVKPSATTKSENKVAPTAPAPKPAMSAQSQNSLPKTTQAKPSTQPQQRQM